jgi:general secretion pathway protein H
VKNRGFTLIEVLAVVMVIALAAGVVAVSIGGGITGMQVRTASRDLIAALRHTRGQAIVKREERVLLLDVENRRYEVPGRPAAELPGGMDLKLETARSEQVSDTVGGVRFYPDGSSTGGNIELIRGESVWRIEINWLTGEIVLLDRGDSR